MTQSSHNEVTERLGTPELAALIETWRIHAPVAGRVTEIKA